MTTDYLIWERSEDAPQAAEQKQGGDTRGRSGIFNDALLLVMTIVVMAAVWSAARTGFASYTALHFVLGAMAIAAAVLACTVWKKRGRPICFGIAAAGAALAIARLASMLGYLVDLWSTSREYADGGDWPIVWESAGIWLRHDWPYYLFYLVLIVGGLPLARQLKKGRSMTTLTKCTRRCGSFRAEASRPTARSPRQSATSARPRRGLRAARESRAGRHPVSPRRQAGREVSSAFAFGGANRQVEL